MANKIETKPQAQENEQEQTQQPTPEKTELPEGMGFGEPSTAYDEAVWEQHREKEWPRAVHAFGAHQNQVNRGTAARLRTLEVENRTLRLKVEQLEKELESARMREKKIFGRVSLELDKLQAEIDRVRLSAKLNSNAIDRLVKGTEES